MRDAAVARQGQLWMHEGCVSVPWRTIKHMFDDRLQAAPAGMSAPHGAPSPAVSSRSAAGTPPIAALPDAVTPVAGRTAVPTAKPAPSTACTCACSCGAQAPEDLRDALGALDAAVDDFVATDLAGQSDDALRAVSAGLIGLAARVEAAHLSVLKALWSAGIVQEDACVSLGSWLGMVTEVGGPRSRLLASAALRLPRLQKLMTLLAEGRTTLAHLTPVVRAYRGRRIPLIDACEEALAELAVSATPKEMATAVARLVELADEVDAKGDADADGGARDPRRSLQLSPGTDAMGLLSGTLDALTRERLESLLEAFGGPDEAEARSATQRRHDAFAALIEHAMASDRLPSTQRARPQVLVNIDLADLLGLDPRDPAARHTLADIAAILGIPLDALLTDEEIADDHLAEVAGDAEDRLGASLRLKRHVARLTAEDLLGADRVTFGSGVPLRPALARRLTRHATLKAVLTLGSFRVAGVGRTQRTLPGWLRDVLAVLHRHCRGPGCDRPMAWTDAHHLVPWSEGGATDLANALPLCRWHHTQVTSGNWRVDCDPHTGEVTWRHGDGTPITLPAPRARVATSR